MQEHKFQDREAHSSGGLGALFTALYCIVISLLKLPIWLYFLAPFVMATAKETIDCIRAKSFQAWNWSDWKATQNPAIIINWYKDALKS